MHYKDGKAAKLGDLVRGKPYNTAHEVVGTVIGLVPGVDSCNLRVAFVEAVEPGATPPRMSLGVAAMWGGSGAGGASEPPRALYPCADYGETKAFELLARGA